MLTYTLSRRERVLLAGFGILLLVLGLVVAAFVRPYPVGMMWGLVAVGTLLALIAFAGRFPLPRWLEFMFPEHLGFAVPKGKEEVVAAPDQAIAHVSIAGVCYRRIRCGDEQDVGGEMDFCSDCLAQEGQYHAIGCDLEECPKCHQQMISCGCNIDALRET
jgi:hypothetical protein